MRAFFVFLLLLFSRASGFPQNDSVCPTDSLDDLSSCFTYFNHSLNWSQAQDVCQQHGLHLITIQNFSEVSAIAALVKNYQQKKNIWIKLEDHSQNIQWKIIHQPGNGHNPLKNQEVIVKQNVCVELIATEGESM
ncbi:regenerating islet-derived protein 4-like [Pipistrellus kuhlii]|uniref:regenerating islet-derived protein 4-like n=1 Tax=Pipistrellus kuhlii TaxID=59472 RepID=UPI001E270E51|nr:regenerating islet-derived protein 4-like [Pipistrellus kuhlii]